MGSGKDIEARERLEERAQRNAATLLSYLMELHLPDGSTTVSEHKISELLASAATVLGLNGMTDEERLAVLAEDDIVGRFQRRRRLLDKEARCLAEEAKRLDRRLERIPCLSLHEDLEALEVLPRTYASHFSAHQLPHELAFEPYGYQNEGRTGLKEARAWLSCLEAETGWLEALDRKDLPELLHKAVPGYEEGTASLRILVEQHLGWLVPGKREDR